MPAGVLDTSVRHVRPRAFAGPHTVLPDLGNAVGPASRTRWEDAARQLADKAHAQLPQ